MKNLFFSLLLFISVSCASGGKVIVTPLPPPTPVGTVVTITNRMNITNLVTITLIKSTNIVAYITNTVTVVYRTNIDTYVTNTYFSFSNITNTVVIFDVQSNTIPVITNAPVIAPTNPPVVIPVATTAYYRSLALPSNGNISFQILTPTILELSFIQAKQPDPTDLPPLPVPDSITINNVLVKYSMYGLKRRAAYAPLNVRNLRVGSYEYLTIPSLNSGDAISIQFGTNIIFQIYDPRKPNPAIHVNQVGYMQFQPKKAMVGYYLGTAGELPITTNMFQLVDDLTGMVLYTNALKLRPDVGYEYQPTPYQQVYEADFSSYTYGANNAKYRIVVPGMGSSLPFIIYDGVAATIARTYALGLYHQRSGTNNVLPYTRFTRGVDHIAPAQIPSPTNAFVNYTLSQTASGPMTNGIAACYYPFVNQGTVDVSGGHFDAGDYSKYTTDVALLIHALLFPVDNFPGVKNLDNLGIPESGDGISDLLQEAKWESDFLLKMQDADGGFYFLVYPAKRPYELDVTPDHGDPQVVFPKNTVATASAVAALAEMASSPTFKSQYPDVASKYLAASIKGWQFLTNAFNAHGRASAYQKITFYGDSFADRDEMAWAAAALYVATGDPVYDNDLRANTPNPNDQQYRQWTWWSMYMGYGCAFRDYAFAARSGRLPASALNPTYLAACEGECRFAATNAMNYSAKMAYGSSFSDENKGPQNAGWYFSGEQTFDLAVAYALEPKPDYLDVILKNYNYELGCNPVNISFVTGLGWNRQHQIVDQYHQNDYRSLPPDGIPLGNIQAGFAWLQLYGGELSAMSLPSDSTNIALYPYYDRWSDTFNTTTEFCTYQQAKSLAAAAMLMASGNVMLNGSQSTYVSQAWNSAPGVIGNVPSSASVGSPITMTATSPGLDLSTARVTWEAVEQDPSIGPTYTIAAKHAGAQWVEMEALLPDGRRVFAQTNFMAMLYVTNTIALYNPDISNDFNLVAWYPLNGTNTEAFHEQKPATLGGNAAYDFTSFSWPTGPGAVVRVHGLGDNVTLTITNSSLYSPGTTTSISIEAMFYVNSLSAYSHGNADMFFLSRTWNCQMGWEQQMWDLNPSLLGNTNTIVTPFNIPTGQWEHLKLIVTSMGYTAELNGFPVAARVANDLSSWAGNGTVSLTIGNFDGWIGDVVVKHMFPMSQITMPSSGTMTNYIYMRSEKSR